MAQRELTVIAFRQLGAQADYCAPRGWKLPEEGEQFCKTDGDLREWIDVKNRQKLNAGITLHQGVVEARIFGPDQTLNECFFQACKKLGLAPRYAIGRSDKLVATSVLFKLRDDEAKRFDEDYVNFKPRAFTLDGERRGVMLNYAPPPKKGSSAHRMVVLAPGSLLWHEDGVSYDLLVWRQESGQDEAVRWQTGPAQIDFFALVRVAAFAAILNIVSGKAWSEYPTRRTFSEWLARVVRDGQAINANTVFAKAARAVIWDPAHAESLIALICEGKGLPETRDECRSMFQLASKRLNDDPTRHDVAGWSAIHQHFGEEAHRALRGVLNVGADSTLLEDFADRYLLCESDGAFIDRNAFREGRDFIFSREALTLKHAPDQIVTKKKPVKAFPVFVESKLRQDVTGRELHPDCKEGAILRVTRQGAIVADDDYAPEHSRLVFNEWAGLYIQPAKTINAALKAECEDKLNHMLSLVTRNHKERADWIKAHFGWTLKHPGQKQQVALVCTGDQSTGKTFLCQDFAGAVFGRYWGKGSIIALERPFYAPNYVSKLWVNHDEVVTKPETIETIKDLIRSTKISGEFKGRDPRTYTTFARLSFTSNEVNPGLSRGADRGLFQVTSITAESEGLLPNQFADRMLVTAKPFYASYSAFLQREDVCQTYVKLLIDCAPERIAQVEDLTYSAMRDADVAAEQLTPAQLIAKEILENGTIHSGYDIAMPFRAYHLIGRVRRASKEMGLRQFVSPDAVRALYFQAGLLENLPSGEFMFKFKIGALQRLFGKVLGVPLRSHWEIEPNDDMPNDWRDGDPMEPWKGRKT